MAPIARPHPVQQNLFDLLQPYGWAHLDFDDRRGTVRIEVTLRCEDCEDTVTAIRAHLATQALSVLTALESAGAEIHDSEITLTKPPVAGKLRAEITNIWR